MSSDLREAYETAAMRQQAINEAVKRVMFNTGWPFGRRVMKFAISVDFVTLVRDEFRKITAGGKC